MYRIPIISIVAVLGLAGSINAAEYRPFKSKPEIYDMETRPRLNFANPKAMYLKNGELFVNNEGTPIITRGGNDCPEDLQSPDIVATVKARMIDPGLYGNAYGIIISYNYYFLVRTGGTAVESALIEIEKSEGRKTPKLLKDWTRVDDIDLKKVNELKIEQLEGLLRCYINNRFIFSARPGQKIGLPYVGVYSEKALTAFDDLSVQRVEMLAPLLEEPLSGPVSDKIDGFRQRLDSIAAEKADVSKIEIQSGIHYEEAGGILYYWCDYHDKSLGTLEVAPFARFFRKSKEAAVEKSFEKIASELKAYAPVFPPAADSPKALKYFNEGMEGFLKGDYDKAIRKFSDAIKTEPKFYSAYLARATSFKRMLAEEGSRCKWIGKVSPLEDRAKAAQLVSPFGEETVATGKKIVVARDGSGDYTKLEQVPKELLKENDVVIVRPGHYNEKLSVNGKIKYMAEGEVVVRQMEIYGGGEVSGFIVDARDINQWARFSAVVLGGTLKNSKIRNARNTRADSPYKGVASAIELSGGVLSNCEIENSDIGIRLRDNSAGTVANNLIKNNDSGIVVENNAGAVVIKNNTVVFNGSGIDVGGKVQVTDNIFAFNNQEDKGKSPSCGWLKLADVAERTLKSAFQNDLAVKNNAFFENTTDVRPFDYYTSRQFEVCVQTAHDESSALKGEVISHAEDFRRQSLKFKEKIQKSNFSVDPMFVDAQKGDFRLKPGSPLIGKGEGGTYIGAFPPAGMEKTPQEKTSESKEGFR